MKLHHTTGAPDWESIAPQQRTVAQRVAATTYGIVTLANFLSLFGFALVCVGLYAIMQHRLMVGVIFIAIGRLCDLLDGIVADRTGTKSSVGEIADAGFDKLGAVAALLVLWTEQIVPWWAVALIGLQNVANICIGAIGWYRKIKLHPVQSGKISTAVEWVAFLCFIAATGGTLLWEWPAYGLLAAALGLGIYATFAYGRELKNTK